MPIITLGATEPDAIIVETGTLPDNFYSTLQHSDNEIQEPVDFETKASLVASYMNSSRCNGEKTNSERRNSTAKTNTTGEGLERKNSRTTEPNEVRVRNDFVEFSARSDGSVNCKLCGKIFASRQHWYRHKYRAHVVDPVPLNKCETCLIFFKSRKGYLGHMSSKHSETLHDATPVLLNDQAGSARSLNSCNGPVLLQYLSKKDDPEIAIPKTVMQNYQTMPASSTTLSKNTSKTRGTDKKKSPASAKAPDETEPDQERRVKEESFVMNIIEKVRRQCETEPEVANRRGYSRKPYSVRI